MPEPNSIYAGSTVDWDRVLIDPDGDTYTDANGWKPKYIFSLLASAGTRLTVVSTDANVTITASGDTFTITLAADFTTSATAGDYQWVLYADKSGSDPVWIARGLLTIKPDILVSTVDVRSHARKMLAFIESRLEGRATPDILEESIDQPGGASRRLKYISPEELIKLHGYYKRLIRDEEASDRVSQGLGSRKKILTRFIG